MEEGGSNAEEMENSRALEMRLIMKQPRVSQYLSLSVLFSWSKLWYFLLCPNHLLQTLVRQKNIPKLPPFLASGWSCGHLVWAATPFNRLRRSQGSYLSSSLGDKYLFKVNYAESLFDFEKAKTIILTLHSLSTAQTSSTEWNRILQNRNCEVLEWGKSLALMVLDRTPE